MPLIPAPEGRLAATITGNLLTGAAAVLLLSASVGAGMRQEQAAAQKPPAAKDQDAQKPPANPQADPVKIDTSVTVFGTAEPKKSDLTTDVRGLPVFSGLLQDVELRRRTFREPAELLRSLPGVDFVYYGQGGIPSGPSVRGYTDRNFGQDMSGHLDGIPLNVDGFVASHGALDLTSILPEAIDRLELIRGPLDGEKNLNTTGTIRSERYPRMTVRAVYQPTARYRVNFGGFAYPGSSTGQSAFLFGSRVGVRPNPRVSVDASLTYPF